MKPIYKHIGILLIVSAIIFGYKAGERDFWGRHGEARRAEVSREMVVSGNWAIPHLNGEPFVTKPPLFYWTVALAFTITGEFDELSARLPSMFSATLGVLVTYFWASALFSKRVGVFAGLILATSFLYGSMARSAETDMLLTLFTTASLWCFTMGYQRRDQTYTFWGRQGNMATLWYLLAWGCVGFGTLTKNPIGLAVPFLAIAGFILITRDVKLILKIKPWWGCLLLLLIILPWFLSVYQRVPNFFDVLNREIIGRYANPEDTPHLKPFYYYIPALGAFVPWIMFLPGAIVSVFSRRTQQVSKSHLFLIITSLTTFLLFSSVGSKREYYLLPLYPILAILVAEFWDAYTSMKSSNVKRWTWYSMDIPIVGFAVFLCVVGLGLPGAAKFYLPEYITSSIGFGGLFLCGGIVLFILFLRGKVGWTFGMYCFVTICIYLFALSTIVPEMDKYRSRKAFLHEVASLVGEHAIVDHNYLGCDAPFYLQRVIPIRYLPVELNAFLESNNPTFVLTTGGWYSKLQRENPEIAGKLRVVLDRVWTSAMNPKRQKRLLLLKK